MAGRTRRTPALSTTILVSRLRSRWRIRAASLGGSSGCFSLVSVIWTSSRGHGMLLAPSPGDGDTDGGAGGRRQHSAAERRGQPAFAAETAPDGKRGSLLGQR